MDESRKIQLLQTALVYLDKSLLHITEIKNCNHSYKLGEIVHNAINFGESICNGNVKNEEHEAM